MEIDAEEKVRDLSIRARDACGLGDERVGRGAWERIKIIWVGEEGGWWALAWGGGGGGGGEGREGCVH